MAHTALPRCLASFTNTMTLICEPGSGPIYTSQHISAIYEGTDNVISVSERSH
jgi:hypothetical protein